MGKGNHHGYADRCINRRYPTDTGSDDYEQDHEHEYDEYDHENDHEMSIMCRVSMVFQTTMDTNGTRGSTGVMIEAFRLNTRRNSFASSFYI